jgi:hypothetical protein
MTQMTFLMGIDDDPTNGFYSLAHQFFAPRSDNKTIAPTKAQGQLSLEDVFATLATAKPVPSVINIVCHAMGFGFMSFPLTRADRDTRQSHSTALSELMPSDAPTLNVAGITGQAQVVIYGCDIGRSRQYVSRLAELFGGPLQIFAPRRVAYFHNDGTGVIYRLAQTWTVPTSQLGYIPVGAIDSGWPGFHVRFAAQVDRFFGPMATAAAGAGGPKTLGDFVAHQAFNQTDVVNSSSFFFVESVTMGPGMVSAANPLLNGDSPPLMKPPSATAVDDTWVVTRMTDTDGVPATGEPPGWKEYAVMVLASIITTEVDFRDDSSFLSMYTSPQIAPKKAGATGSASSPVGPSGPTGDPGSLTDQLLAAGIAQTDLDPLLAALVPTAAGDDSLLAADADVPPANDVDDDNIDQPQLLEDV